MTFNSDDLSIYDMDIEKIDSTHFKITMKLSDGRILVAENVNLGVASVQQEEKIMEYYPKASGGYYSIVEYFYKIFLEGVCCNDKNGSILKVYDKERFIK